MYPLKLLVLVCALIVASACGGDADNSGDPIVVGGADETVVMTDNEFNPGNLQVPTGATVTFTNEGNAVHNATADDDSWETDNLSDGESEALTFETAGDFAYVCTIHPGMKARITVIADGGGQS